MGQTRKETLTKLLAHVETDIGRMMIGDRRDINDRRDARRREEVRERSGGTGGGNGN